MPDIDKPTCGVGYNDYMVQRNTGSIPCQIWDTAGQEKYGALVPVYIRDTDLCLIALPCNESVKVNLASLAHWTKMIETVSSGCRIVVVGTKCDLVADNKQPGCECSGQDYLLTSSLMGVGIDELRELLAREIAESLRTDR
ncbi:Ras family GTPase [uncultured virus]|nr:Ras family GTPase [uncultured virus]